MLRCVGYFFVNNPFMIVNFVASVCRCVTYFISISFIGFFHCTFGVFHPSHMPLCDCNFITFFKLAIVCTIHVFWCFTIAFMLHMFFFMIFSFFIFCLFRSYVHTSEL